MLTIWLGYLAAITSTVALLPQIIKTYRLRSAADISWLMLWNFLVSSVLWIAYGSTIHSLPVMMANVAGGMFSLFLLGLKWHCDAR